MTPRDFDALIVGAGVAGSSAAILLAQAGWSVAVVEKRAFPRRKVCGECIAASNLPLLDALGVGEEFAAHAGAPLRRVAVLAGEHEFTAALPRYDHPVHGWGRAFGREHLDTLLLARARSLGASIWQPWTVRAIERDHGRHRVRLRETGAKAQPGARPHASPDAERDTVLSASILIDAHGSWEADPEDASRAEPSRRAPPRDSDLFAFKGNFSGAALDADLLPVLAFPGGYGGMVIAENARLTLACCVRRDRLQAIRAEAPGVKAALAVQGYLEANCRGVRRALANAKLQDEWLSVGPIRPGIRLPARSPDTFVIGNAAGEAHPILGEGISMAIQSAWLLAAEIVPRRAELVASGPAGGAGASAATAYATAWRSSFAPRIRTAAVFSHLAMRPSIARALVPALRRWPGILTAGARLGGKVRCVVDPAAMSPSP